MICPECKYVNPAENHFCGMCGARLEPVPPAEVAEETPDAVEVRETREEEPEHLAPIPEAPARIYESGTTSVSGPSFLGLGSDTDCTNYLLEDEPRPSHIRRNLVLLALVAMVAMAALEWRANRGGTVSSSLQALRLKLPTKHAKTEPAASSPTPEPAANNNGSPQFVAEPVKPAVQASPTPATSATPVSTTTPEAPTAQNSVAQNVPQNDAQPAPGVSQPPAAATPAAASAQPSPSPSPVQEATNVPPRARANSSIPQSEGPVQPVPKKKPEVPSDESLNAGQAELQQGVAAGATDLGRRWLWKATAKGNGVAPVLLAQMYLDGSGVTKDCDQAILLLQTAARKNNPRARSKLGSLYATGQCVPRDRVQAYRWMSSALDANPGSEWLAQNRESLWNQMTPGERQRARPFR